MNGYNFMRNPYFFFLFLPLCLLLATSCNNVNNNQHAQHPGSKIDTIEARVLPPAEALKHFILENNFNIQLVASEPTVSAPVAMNFDTKGRLWVVEMNAYMPDTSGNGEEEPIGKVVILEDTNHDGIMDTRKVFMDSLVMPRAICLFNDGILVAEPPKLWFAENDHDKAGKKYLVDSTYAAGGNVEHQPNGLLRGLDNWIYNAKSDWRYRRVGKNKWLKDRTHFRGQWGISQDELGRLYYNTNSENLIGDYFSPGLGGANPHQQRVEGYDENIVPDNRVYPAHATPGVNRGYMKGVLDDSLRLVDFTAACGPLLFNSYAYGKDYYDNAFVAEPSANLIKRNILSYAIDSTHGREAYKNKEFLASTDERFRPVNLYAGPDGAMYVVDMYRGIIQHKTYLTPYLAGEVMKRGLEQPLNCGRIYKIVPDGINLPVPVFNRNADSLLSYLSSPNQWLRQTAHDLIVDEQLTSLVPALKKMLRSDTLQTGRINALWVLEGLNALHNNDLLATWQNSAVMLKQQILTAAIAIMKNKQDADFWINKYPGMMNENIAGLAPYLAYLGASALQYSRAANDILIKTAVKYKGNNYVADAVISGLHDKEILFLKRYTETVKDTSNAFIHRLKTVIENADKQKLAAIANKNMDKNLLAGKQLFKVNCQVCHGDDGNGIKGLGAPLNESNWVQGDKAKLLSVVLYGLTGPIKVGDKTYQPPDVAGAMPGMNTNDKLTNQDVAYIVSYIRKAWNNKAGVITEEDVKTVRQKYKGRQESFTMKELLQ
jgi:mono/diheme cytochrome c family protein/glucose/arabinose dehydrogenase